MNIKKYSWLAACAWMLASCQSDALKQELQQKGTIYTITSEMSQGNAMSRAQIQLNNTNSGHEVFFWNEGDKFDLYQQIRNSVVSGDPNEFHTTVFSITDGYEDNTSATFRTENPAYATVDYVAVYPSGHEMDYYAVEVKTEKELNFSNATSQAAVDAVWQNYFKNNMYMVAAGNFDEPEHVVTFNHVCGLFRVTYTNKTSQEQTIDGIRFGGDQKFPVSCELSVVEGFGSSSQFLEEAELKTTGLKVASGESANLYMFFFPTQFGEGDMEISILRGADDSNKVSIPLETISNANDYAQRLEPGKRYWFKITETENGLIWSKEETVTIPNPQLSVALQGELGDEVVSINSDGYAVIKKSDIDKVTKLEFDNYADDNYTINSLDGIEHFIHLEKLVCIHVGLEGEVDLRLNTALKHVEMNANLGLTTLNISGLKNLTALKYSETSVQTLDIHSEAITKIQTLHYGRHSDEPQNYVPNVNLFTSLNDLSCYGQTFELTDADIKAQLITLDSYNCNITELNLEEYPNLVTLACYNNNLTELIIPEGSQIGHLNCFGNQLTSLDITPLANTLYGLYCGNQKTSDGEYKELTLILTESQMDKWNEQGTGWYDSGWGLNDNVKLNVSGSSTPSDGTVVIGNADLSEALLGILGSEQVTINENGHAVMKQEDVNNVTSLNFRWGQYDEITTLNGIGHFKNLQSLTCQGKENLTELDLRMNTALQSVTIASTGITSLDLSKNIRLTSIRCYENPYLATLSLPQNEELGMLDVAYTNLTSLTIYKPENLNYLDYSGTGLSFDLSKSDVWKALESLGLEGKPNDFAGLSSALKKQLRNLNCSDCNLSTINLLEYENLTELNCSNNKLTELDASVLPGLNYLYANSNKLSNINLSGLENLWSIEVRNNALTTLDLSHCGSLRNVYCAYNQLTELDLSSIQSLDWVSCGQQKDATGKAIPLVLKLHNDMVAQWVNEWSKQRDNQNVTLDSGVESGNGNTGGNDFPIGGNF